MAEQAAEAALLAQWQAAAAPLLPLHPARAPLPSVLLPTPLLAPLLPALAPPLLLSLFRFPFHEKLLLLLPFLVRLGLALALIPHLLLSLLLLLLLRLPARQHALSLPPELPALRSRPALQPPSAPPLPLLLPRTAQTRAVPRQCPAARATVCRARWQLPESNRPLTLASARPSLPATHLTRERPASWLASLGLAPALRQGPARQCRQQVWLRRRELEQERASFLAALQSLGRACRSPTPQRALEAHRSRCERARLRPR